MASRVTLPFSQGYKKIIPRNGRQRISATALSFKRKKESTFYSEIRHT